MLLACKVDVLPIHNLDVHGYGIEMHGIKFSWRHAKLMG